MKLIWLLVIFCTISIADILAQGRFIISGSAPKLLNGQIITIESQTVFNIYTKQNKVKETVFIKNGCFRFVIHAQQAQ
ncbi:MAG: hypothetical protein IPQ27_09975 [Chitinophagaceae bacterium]|nr:hypothetical protein [Chitinophagaceae bacterium]